MDSQKEKCREGREELSVEGKKGEREERKRKGTMEPEMSRIGPSLWQ